MKACVTYVLSSSYRVCPLEDALGAPDVWGQPQLESEHPGVEGGEVVAVLSAGHDPQDSLVKTGLTRVLPGVVVGTQLEGEVSLVVGSHVNLGD